MRNFREAAGCATGKQGAILIRPTFGDKNGRLGRCENAPQACKILATHDGEPRVVVRCSRWYELSLVRDGAGTERRKVVVSPLRRPNAALHFRLQERKQGAVGRMIPLVSSVRRVRLLAFLHFLAVLGLLGLAQAQPPPADLFAGEFTASQLAAIQAERVERPTGSRLVAVAQDEQPETCKLAPADETYEPALGAAQHGGLLPPRASSWVPAPWERVAAARLVLPAAPNLGPPSRWWWGPVRAPPSRA